MARILVVDSDRSILDTWSAMLSLEGFDVATADCGCKGVALAVSRTFDVILSELRLPHLSGLEIARRLREAHVGSALVIVTGFGSVRSAVDAMHLGATDYLEKPLFRDDIIRVVNYALTRARSPGPEAPPHDLRFEAHATTRWARMITRATHSTTDLKTLHSWARFIAVSDGTLKSWCRTANLSPRRSLVLARLLRAVILREDSGRQFQELLDVIDARTLKKMLKLGGLSGAMACNGDAAQAVDGFLAAQCLIRDQHALSELRGALMVEHPGLCCHVTGVDAVYSAVLASGRRGPVGRAQAERD